MRVLINVEKLLKIKIQEKLQVDMYIISIEVVLRPKEVFEVIILKTIRKSNKQIIIDKQ